MSGSIGTQCAAYCGHAYMINRRRAKDLYKTLYTSREGKYPIGILSIMLLLSFTSTVLCLSNNHHYCVYFV